MPALNVRSRGSVHWLVPLLLVAGVLAATVFLYREALAFPFVEWDDPNYLQRNDFVKRGLSWANVRWACTTGELANWHPLTWLSFMLEVQLFGVDARVAHTTNVVLHLADTALLFWLLGRGTGRWTLAACVAGLFALHPQRVESVAWISERKGLLSTTFGLLAIGAYGVYTARGGALRWLAIAGSFACSLLAKPMLVTLPLLLLVLDLWPLHRLESPRVRASLPRLVREKAPLLGISLGSALVTWLVQRAGGAMGPGEALSFADRLAHAIVAPIWYLGKAIAPANLSPLYTHPYLPGGTPWSAWQVAGSAALLVAVSSVAWRARRAHPYLLAGWLWYVVSLVPVLGLVQVGFQAYADRYTCIPLLGPLVAGVWLVADLVQRPAVATTRRAAQAAALFAALAATAALAFVTHSQIPVWRSSLALFGRAIALSPDDPTAHLKLGNAYKQMDDRAHAALHYEHAVRVHPSWFKPRLNLGHMLLELKQPERAIPHFEAAAQSPASQGKGHRYLGFTYWQLGRHAEAEIALREALRLDPVDSRAWNALAVVLEALGRPTEALPAYEEAARLEPRWPDPQASAVRLRGH